MLTTSDEQRQANAKYLQTININNPRFNDTTAIVLLHQNAQERKRAISYKENQVVSEVLLAKIQAEVYDAVVVASLSENMDHRLMFLSENKQSLNPLVWPNAEDLLIDFSKCDQHQKAIVTNGEELDINPEGEAHNDTQFDTSDSSCDGNEEEC
ncbi:unnamed protein product [Allacma fusca]|uniref:Uncharacterized protein n=1 Tax=Allacma fusca TaxID=39272 RepID=A0A8J2KM67_9HEXA|nr:unnamed protein product [Allacma fusca]